MFFYKTILVNWNEKRQTDSKVETAVEEGLHKSTFPIDLFCREKKSIYMHRYKPWYYHNKE